MLYKNSNRQSHPYRKTTKQRAQDLVEKLINNESVLPQLLNIEVFSALFCKRNETFLEEMRWCFREKLVNLCETLNTSSSTMLEKQKFLNRHVCTLPLAGIKTGQEYLIPAYDEASKNWQLVTYKVMPIELSPSSGLGRLVLADNNRLFAYGFTPKDPKHKSFASRRLVFISPEYPAQQGFLANLYLWFQSASGFYKSCESDINHWIDDNFDEKKNVKITVLAVGHAARLAFETAFTNNASKIDCISISDAYNLPYSISKNYKSRWNALSFKPKITVQMREKHYTLPEIMPDWSVYDSKGEILKTKIVEEYCKIRIASNILSGIANALLIMPCQYLFIPTIRAILNHKTELALLSILVMVFVMLPGLVMTDIGTTLAVFTALYFGFKLISPLKVMFNAHEHAEAACHKADIIEERAADDYFSEILNSKAS